MEVSRAWSERESFIEEEGQQRVKDDGGWERKLAPPHGRVFPFRVNVCCR